MRILEFVFVFSFIIFIHELGHYVFSKLFKIEVEEFGFGFPPRLLKIGKIQETDISINWIPFGGFVRLRGETEAGVPGGYAQASVLARFSSLIGGPLFNLILGVILFTVIFMRLGVPDTSTVQIYGVSEGSPALAAGINAGDVVLSVNNQAIESIEELSALVNSLKGSEVSIVLRAPDGSQRTVTATPRVDPPPDQGSLGITMTNPYRDASVLEAVPYALRSTGGYAYQLLALPGQIIRGSVSAEQARPVGPLGIYSIYTQARDRDQENAASANPEDRMNTLLIVAVLSVALGFTNLLPIPALDRGRILLLLPEIFLRKKLPQKFENAINAFGMVALITLMVVITTLDIVRPVVIP